MINKLNKMLMEGKKENDHHQEKKRVRHSHRDKRESSS